MKFTIEPYERKHKEGVLSLLFYSRRLHTHLDWYKVGQWIDMEDNCITLALEDDTVIGVLGVGEPLHNAAWLRLASVQRGYDPTIALVEMWEMLRYTLAQQGISSVSALLMNMWLSTYFPAMGFEYLEDVVTMHRAGKILPDEPPVQTVKIRHGYLEDVRAIAEVDQAAFAPPWQMSQRDVRYAQRQAASCTVAEYEGRIVAYQMSTRHQTAGHLARLAVVPDMQGKQVGGQLLHHVLSKFDMRGVRGVTVNTQLSNERSQRLYRRYGFLRNGFDLGVWRCLL